MVPSLIQRHALDSRPSFSYKSNRISHVESAANLRRLRPYRPDRSRSSKRVLNGLMVALLAHRPIRIKNFATLEIGRTFKQVQDNWWIALPACSTKTKRLDERRVPEILNGALDLYLDQSRPFLIGSNAPTDFLWISSRTGGRFATKNLGTLFQDHVSDTWGGRIAPPVPNGGSNDRSDVRRQFSSSRQRRAPPYRFARYRGALYPSYKH